MIADNKKFICFWRIPLVTAAISVCFLSACKEQSPKAVSEKSNNNSEHNTWKLSQRNSKNEVSFTDKIKSLVSNGNETVVIDDGRGRSNREIWNHDDAQSFRDDPNYRLADEYIQSQRYAEAKELLVSIVSKQPESSSVWRRLGDCYYNLLELDSAVAAYEKSLALNRENYFSMRGLAFAMLYFGHDLWSAREYAKAHGKYAQALKSLQQCLRIYPGDLEAMYGRSMAAEGASRRLYQNAVALSRQGEHERASAEARNCFEVIDEGIAAAKQRIAKKQEEIGSRNVAGGLFQRRAMLSHELKKYEFALQSIEQAIKAYDTILKIAPDNALAQKERDKCEKLRVAWEAVAAKSTEH